MIFDRRWTWVFIGLFYSAYLILINGRERGPFSDEEPSQQVMYILIMCSDFAYIATGLLKMLHRLLTRGRNGGRIRLPEGSWQSRIRIQ
ncbi:hypothetical protein B0H14DRAFT_3061344 [Mycena olivaceomarginata]|nr:hypothetical protein B0H14DRAFT_3061344 [Mycena olivaceomarginata]